MTKYEGDYEFTLYGTHVVKVVNRITRQEVTKVWAFPVKRSGYDSVPETHYFATSEERNAYYDDHDYCDKLPRCKVWSDMIENYNKEETTMKSIQYKGTEIEITAIRFIHGDDTIVQDGLLVHDTSDEFGDGDAIYGNGWTIGIVQDEADVESLLTSGDCSTCFSRNDDGTYTVE